MGVSREFEGCFKEVLRVLTESFKGASRKWKGLFQKSFKGVSRKIERCFNEVQLVFEESFKDVSRMFQGSFKGVSRKI